ncbi:MAG TPA: helix-turn-helix transcriptional regulator [Candidatus Angelobacter sp.]|nr:helix-turn-helix transcriptional regulator [Candidatus Angelobacter sp.]
MQGIRRKFGKRIRELRRTRGFSQEGFADKCGFHRNYMGSIERGKRNITFEEMTSIAKALKISLSGLFKGV